MASSVQRLAAGSA
jgi:hypothetical protein